MDTLFKGYPELDEESTEDNYTEKLLHLSNKSNKYYSSFQSYNKQFIESQGGTIVRWSNSAIESTSRIFIDSWEASDHKKLSDKSDKSKDKFSNGTALFSWSSSDAYVEKRKRELQIQRGELVKEAILNKTETTPTAKQTPHTKESMTYKLNLIAEREANKFVHSRIQLIKEHHSDEMNKQIHDRRRKDHEMHLKKLKLKEEEYDRQLQALSLENKSNGTASAFFNSLFGLSSDSTSNLSAPGELAPSTADTSNSTTTSVTSRTTVNSKSSNTPLVGSKNKRFSFLPLGAMWGTPKKPSKTGDFAGDNPEESEDDSASPRLSKEAEIQTSPEINITTPIAVSHISPPISVPQIQTPIAVISPQLQAPIISPQIMTPRVQIATPQILQPVILPKINHKVKAQERKIAQPAIADDDFDDFDDFTSAVSPPVLSPVKLNHAVKSPSNLRSPVDLSFSLNAPPINATKRHLFIPLESTIKQPNLSGKPPIHSDLLDIFDQPQTFQKSDKNTAESADLLSF